MYRFDYTDLVGGMLLFFVGAGVSLVSIGNYPLGTLPRMGPGMFPAILGVVLAALGVSLALQALRRTGSRPDIRFFSPLFVLGGVTAFALTIVPFGLIPAIVAIVVISSLAELRIRPVSLVLLCLALCLMAPLVFVVGLGLPIPLIRWPF
ncbi:tripartite tricarboxylate transporter TctB family protein [Roseibium marinum]|uniref:Tripartite tricarboxylate transporter TctB family protein n=1 Tax=Roseibium marinum TaxID=281252 RepID=A0A2S3UX62_9HYPH|nr:tripartite tricarboxylate transporter TctB family protein [Roseibium marinum]POF32170.1 tripartite tricarboxylate transporter TctB family protein [Roseibium marinum]